MNLLTVFLTGLLTGGLSCLAVQGGLLTATLAQTEREKILDKSKTNNALPILAFLIAKLAAYTILGLLLGLFGSVFQLSIATRVILQLFVVVFMVGSALNMLQLHPIFRYFAIQPPRFLTQLIRHQSKSKSMFAPAILGAFTIFIPCGTTQAMMALAVGSGNPISAALIMFVFVLGTSPVFYILGYLTTKLGGALQQKFMKVAAIAILLLAGFNLNAALALSGNPTLTDLGRNIVCTITFCGKETKITGINDQGLQTAVSEATINIGANGYDPNILTVKTNSQVTLHLKNNGGGGCAAAFTIPTFNIQTVVPIGQTQTITFNTPNKTGDIPFTCSMGMYRGIIRVI
jgi:sulfite exporter TauE/SafE